MTKPIRHAAPYLAIAIGAAVFYGIASGIEFDGAGSGRIGPAAWPKIILGLLIATALVGAARAFFTDPGAGEVLAPLVEGDSEVPAKTWPQLTVAGIALFAGYTIALEPLGFIVATALLLGLFMLVGRYRNYRVIMAASLGGSLVFFFLFKKVVYLSLPLGKGPFLGMTLVIMKLMGIT